MPRGESSERVIGVIGKPLRRVDARAKVTGADPLRRRSVAARHAAHEAAALDGAARAHRSASTRARALAYPGVQAGADRRATSRCRSASCRSRRTSTRCAPTACASSAIRWPRSIATDELTAYEAAALVDVALRAADDDRRRRGGARHARAAHPRLRRRRQRPQGGRARLRRRRRRRSPAPTACSRTCFFFRATRTCRSSSTPTLAYLDPDGKLTVASSTQTPHYLHRALAKVLGLPGVADPRHRHAATAAASAASPIRSTTRSSPPRRRCSLGRPVKIALTREEVFYCHRGRHPVLMKIRTGVRKTEQGSTSSGRSCETLLDGGAYGSYGVASTFYTGALADGDLPDRRATASAAAAPSPTSRRAAPSAATARRSRASALEVHIDKMCAALGVDPAELAHRQRGRRADSA